MSFTSNEKTAVDELLEEDSPEGYFETLSDFYAAYTGSEHSDGTTPQQRSLVLIRFKALRRFLISLQQERSPTNLIITKEIPWIQ